MAAAATSLRIVVAPGVRVSGLMLRPRGARACLVMAHGAGAGMRHPFMADMALQFALNGIATLRFQFPYMQNASRRPDGPALCHATVRAAVGAARRAAPRLPLFAGGKSFGGRMTSQAQAEEPLPRVAGLVFLGFPLHAPGAASLRRGEHLALVEVPMLFLQGTRDALAQWVLVKRQVKRLRGRATLIALTGADHAFHVPVKSGRSDAEVRASMAAAAAQWMESLPAGISPAPP